MICPNCRQFTPDQGSKCIRCGAAIPGTRPASYPERVSPQAKDAPSAVRPWMAVVAGLLLLLGYLAFTRLGRSHAVNAFQPGAEFAVEAHLQKGKTNIIDFYSEYCPPCRKISPLLARLGEKRPDVAVLKVDINRKGIEGIDWSSPVARQYNLTSIPHFQIYDGEGILLREGREAYVEVMRMLVQAGIDL